jgi:hypothetical protein
VRKPRSEVYTFDTPRDLARFIVEYEFSNPAARYKTREQLTQYYTRLIEANTAPKPTGNWWVTNQDTTPDNKRVTGPYSTAADAAKAREALERYTGTNINYWVEELEIVK